MLTDDVGGAFGLKTGPYPEYIAQMVGAKKLGRPIHWMSGRSEAFLSDNQARDIYSEAELALDDKGRFLALRIRNTGNLGAYVGPVGANIPTLNFTRCLPGIVRHQTHRHQRAVRLYQHDHDRALSRRRAAGSELRARARCRGSSARHRHRSGQAAAAQSHSRLSAMPYKTAVGTTYDSGDFAPIFDKALALADYDGIKARRREAKKRGKYRGIGLSCMLEHSGGAPLEGALLTFPGDGTLDGQSQRPVDRPGPRLGVSATGGRAARHCARQGHAPARRFGAGDRGLRLGRLALGDDRGRLDRQMHRLDASKKASASRRWCLRRRKATSPTNAGRFGVVGTDRRIALFELAARAAELKKRGAIAEDLDTKMTTETPLSFPNGVHVAEVEIDPETGHMEIVAYTAVDDCGNALDAMIVEGQLHGALAQGLGQALMEQVFYDESGQLVTGSFQDYAMPRAADMPRRHPRRTLHNVPATTNPLGVKGVGEAGTTASIAAVMNAVADALPGGAGAHLDMPVTAARLWEACQRAKGLRSGEPQQVGKGGDDRAGARRLGQDRVSGPFRQCRIVRHLPGIEEKRRTAAGEPAGDRSNRVAAHPDVENRGGDYGHRLGSRQTLFTDGSATAGNFRARIE